MANKGDSYTVRIEEAHINWGVYRNPTNRPVIEGESYVKIPSRVARDYKIERGNEYVAHFTNGIEAFKIKASGNGPYEDGIQYAKQFEGIGQGACKAFTPWYNSCNAKVGDEILVEFLSPADILFTIK